MNLLKKNYMWDTRELKGKGLSPSKILGWLLKYLTYWKKLQILNHLSLFNNEFSLRSRCQQVEFPLRTLSPSCKWLPFCLSPHSLSFVNPCCLFVCLNILLQKPSLKKISHIDEGPPQWPHFNAVTSLKALSPNQSHFGVPEPRASTYKLWGTQFSP